MNAAECLAAHRVQIVDTVVDRQFDRQPELVARYGASGRERTAADARFNVSFLAQALELDDPAVFLDYIAWLKVVLLRRHVLVEDLVSHLACLVEVLGELLPPEHASKAASYVTDAMEAIPDMPSDLPGTDDTAPLSPLAHQYFEALQRGERATASKLVLAAVAKGTPLKDIYLHVFQPAQYELGRLWQTNRITVAQEHYCTAATQLVMSQLYQHVFASPKNGYRMVATCVADNLHELGVRMVADFFEMDGWDSYYLGASVPHGAVLDTVEDCGAELLAISAALAPQVDDVRALITAARARPALNAVTILVGGHAFNRDAELWRRVGADGFASDAQGAIELAVRSVTVGAA